MIYIQVADTRHPAKVEGQTIDPAWDGRATKSITLERPYDQVKALLPDGTPWSIVSVTEVQTVDDAGNPVFDKDGRPVTEEITEEWDNSDYSMSGPITDNRDGTVTIKMGKPTDLETAYELLIGGGDEV